MMPKDKKRIVDLSYATSIPMILLGYPMLSVLVGHFLDDYWGCDPVLTIIFFIFGAIAAMREIMMILKRINRADEDDREKK